MKLEYLWIEDFKNIYNSGISFSNKFEINVQISDNKEKFKITINDNDLKTPKNFFGNKIEDINVIVGKNGSGKTNLLNLIHGKLPISSNHLHIYYDRNYNKLFYISSLNIDINNKSNTEIFSLYDINQTYQIPKITKYKLVLEAKQITKYIKCNLEFAPIFREINLNDDFGEFSRRIFYDEENKMLKNSYFGAVNSMMITKVLNFILDNNISEILDINIPDEITIHINEDNKTNLSPYREINNNSFQRFDPFLGKAFRIFQERLKNNQNGDKNHMVLYITTYYLKYLLLQSESLSEKWNYNRYNEYLNNKSNFRKVENVLDIYLSEILDIQEEDRLILKKKHKETKETLENMVFQIKTILKIIKNITEKSVRYLGDPNRFQLQYEINDNELKLIKLLELICNGDNIISVLSLKSFTVDWYGMSSGEFNILKTMAKIHYFSKQIKYGDNQIETALILIDEPDSSLHPELARNFINILKKVKDIIFEDIDINIQYILSTHSPFILSDVFNSNCIFLDKNEYGNLITRDVKLKTFAANLYDLLTHGFFMENSTSQFAINRIQKLLKTVDNSEINFIKKIIGDPIIKETLIDILEARKDHD